MCQRSEDACPCSALNDGLVLTFISRTPARDHSITAAAYVIRHACQWITQIGNATTVHIENEELRAEREVFEEKRYHG